MDLDIEPELFNSLREILEDFKVHWGDLRVYPVWNYHVDTPIYEYCVALTDPCTTVKNLRLLTQKTIQDIIFVIAEPYAYSEAVPVEEPSFTNDTLLLEFYLCCSLFFYQCRSCLIYMKF